MFADIFNLQYDSYHPEYSLTLVNSVRSFINLKLDHEKKTPEFITELHRRLYFIHEYNCHVAKLTREYPQSRQFELLLIKYVELEYDALYSKNPHPSHEVEVAAELRILRLLQVMLYSAVHNNENLVSKHTDRAVKRAVLQLLGEVKPAYLDKNKLICNIANKLLKRIHGNSKKFHCKQSVSEVHRNPATSDYGSEDSDSDFESNIFSTKLFACGNSPSSRVRSTTSDCVEVPLVTDGCASVPTIEFTDDDDNYFVYLEKRVPTKRKIQDDCKTSHRKKNVSEIASNNLSRKNALEVSINSDSKENTKSDKNSKNLSHASEKSRDLSSSCVVICSDSEDDVCEVTNVSSKNNDVSTSQKQAGVVTFEILDDDDDDQSNYMVYLQKEVETNKKQKKPKKVSTEEIIICSDTEDESSAESSKRCLVEGSEDRGCSITSFNENKIVPLTQIETEKTLEQPTKNFPESSCTNYEQENENNITEEQLVDKTVNFRNNEREKSISADNMAVDWDPDVPQASTSKNVDTKYLALHGEPDTTSSKNLNGNFLVDPVTILEQSSQTQQESDISFQNHVANEISMPVYTQVEMETNIPGGPLMSEKVDAFEDLGNTSECRINESLLEEILLDDTYLLEGRREFEELEYFLFNDNTDRQGFSLSNFSLDESEMVSQPETFDADIKSLESFLDDSQLLSVINSKPSTSVNNCEDLLQCNGSTAQINGKKMCNTLYKNCESETKSLLSGRKYARTVFKHTLEINR